VLPCHRLTSALRLADAMPHSAYPCAVFRRLVLRSGDMAAPLVGKRTETVWSVSLDLFMAYVLPTVVTILFWRYKQATPGKPLLSVRIVEGETGARPSVGKCIGRYFAYAVSSLPFLVGLILVAFDRRKRGWHDMIAGTVLIRTRRGASEAL
jgi:uncharacterized RDD family membrane protein YckC